MTPKQKAKELVDRFKKIGVEIEEEESIYFKRLDIDNRKQCALICVNEKLEFLKKIAFYIDEDNYHFIKNEVIIEKQEIEKL